jgi:DNA polymerase III subunit delta
MVCNILIIIITYSPLIALRCYDSLTMVIVITGPNDYARRECLSQLKADFIKEQGDFGLEIIEAENVELGRLLESVSSLPFLASRRMIILDEPSANKSLSENIEQLLDAVTDTTDLIITEAKFDKRSNLYKVLKKKTDFREFNELNEQELARWLTAEAKERGGELSLGDANYLVQRVGTSQLLLSNELDKLLTYDSVINRDSINLLTEPLPQSTVFELLDAAFAGNHKRANQIYQEQRKQQVEPQAIMGMIAWQLHALTIVKTNEKRSVEEIASRAKLNPFVVRKTLNLCRKLSLKDVKDLVGRALELDIKLKTKSIDADETLQHFLLTIISS